MKPFPGSWRKPHNHRNCLSWITITTLLDSQYNWEEVFEISGTNRRQCMWSMKWLSYLPLKKKQLHNGKGRLDWSDHETEELKILRGISKINNSITVLEIKEQILASAGSHLARSHRKLPRRAKGPRRAGWCSRSALSEHKNSSSHFAESQASTAEDWHR